MHVTSKDQIHTPITNPRGETIYELVGTSSEAGGATQHSLAHVVIPPGKSSDAHYHKSSEESYTILRGSARMILDGDEFVLEPNQACLILPGEVHQIFCDGDEDLEFLAICVPPWTQDDSYV